MPHPKTSVSTSASNPARRYRYLVCLLIFLCYFLVYFHRVCPAVIALDMQQAFSVGGALLGLLGSAYFYSYAAMQLPVGLLADSWGARKTVSASFVVAAVGSVLMGSAPNLGLALVGRVLVGLGVSTVFVCNYKILAEWFEPHKFIIMGGMFQAVGGIGALSAGVPLALASDGIGWRATLVLIGGATLIMAVLVWFFVRNRPAEKGWPPITREDGSAIESVQSAKIGLLSGIKTVLKARGFWTIALTAFCGAGVSLALAGLWGGPYLMHVYGMTKAGAGTVMGGFALALVVGGLINAALANRFGRKPVVICCCLVLTILCGWFWHKPDGQPLFMLYALFFLLSICGAGTAPVIATVSKELFPASIAGTSVGLVNVFPFLGAALFQVAIGAIVGAGRQADGVYSLAGYKAMWLFCLIASACSLAASFLLTETLPGETDK